MGWKHSVCESNGPVQAFGPDPGSDDRTGVPVRRGGVASWLEVRHRGLSGLLAGGKRVLAGRGGLSNLEGTPWGCSRF
jgi:hypothetical protein